MKQHKLSSASLFKGKRVWLHSGGDNDKMVRHKTIVRTAKFFKVLVGEDNVDLYIKNFGHIVPSIVGTDPCDSSSSYSVRNCADGVGKMWSFIMPFRHHMKKFALNWEDLGRFYRASTKNFTVSGHYAENIGDYTRIFVPNTCKKGGCHLHVYLHGCFEAKKD